MTSFPIIIIFLFLTLTLTTNSQLLLEDGYTVTTLIDGDKLNINPNAVLSGSLPDDVIVLDSVKSSVYTVSFKDGDQVSEIKKLSGDANGEAGYKDGDLGSAKFNKPKSFAIDRKKNIYIADKSNHVIRKISKSGVTTIAGGNIRMTGKADGPAQNASFSDDFELAFDPQRCALLIADHGNRLVRQLNLKAEDCADSSSGSVLGSTAAWSIGLVVACLIGLMAGFVIRPYVLPYEASGHQQLNVTWKHYLMNLVNQLVIFSCVTKSAIASHNNLYHLSKKFLTLSFNQLTLIFGLNIIRPRPTPIKPVSLLDCDVLPQPSSTNHVSFLDYEKKMVFGGTISFLDYDDLSNHEMTKTNEIVDELKDLLTFDGSLGPNLSLDQENVYRVEEKNDLSLGTGGNIDKQICANFASFVEGSKTTSSGELWDMKH